MKKAVSEQKEQPLKLVVCTSEPQKPTVMMTFLSQFKDPSLEQVTVSKYSEIFPIIENEIGAIVILTVMTKDDLPEVLQLLSKLDSKLSATHKVLVYNQLNNDKLVQLLRSKGVFDVLDQAVSLKAFQYKFNKCLAVFQSAVKRAKTNAHNAGAGFGSKGAGDKKGGKQAGEILWIDAVEHFSDFWLIMNPKHVRFVIGKWFINFYGPGPSCGAWEQFGESKNGEQGWIFNLRDQKDERFYKNQGRWVFYGNCPEFSWEEKHWYFISKHPELSFYMEKEVLHTKVKILENGNLECRQNSRTGTGLKDLIAESIEASVLLDGDKSGPKVEEEIESDKKRAGFEKRTEAPKEKKYRGRFSEQFEERKKQHDKNYENSELQLGLVSKNGVPIKDRVGIDLVELREKYVVLDVPAGLLMVDDQIELEAFLRQGGEERRVSISAATQIVETEDDEEAQNSKDHHAPRSVAICELNEKIAPQFIDLVQTFKSRREEMSGFFAKAKGAA